MPSKNYEITKEVMIVLEQCIVDGNKLLLPPGLDRKLYVKVNTVLDGLGGKWNRKQQAHVFPSDPAESIEDAILTGGYQRLKNELEYFPTPDAVIDLLIQDIRPEMSVLEPSAGEGHIAKRLLEMGCTVLCCEQHPPFREKLKELSEEYGGNLVLYREPDFLKLEDTSEYDAVVANPPFSKQQDVDHVWKMLDFLVNRGTLLRTVMSEGITFRTTKKTEALRFRLEKMKNYKIDPLPENSFKTSGTSVNTVMVSAEK